MRGLAGIPAANRTGKTSSGASFSDNFNRSNGTLTTPWIVSGLSGSSLPVISSNVVITSSAGSLNYIKWNTAANTDNCFSQVDVTFPSSSGPYTEGGVLLVDGTGNNYQFSWWIDTNVGNYTLYENASGGSFTQLATAAAGVNSGTRTLKITRTSTGTITCYANGAQVLQVTSENTYDTQYPGIAIYTSSGGTNAQLDNWTGGDT